MKTRKEQSSKEQSSLKQKMDRNAKLESCNQETKGDMKSNMRLDNCSKKSQ
jgi:hypothetical protein